ncbi:FAD-dependent oxidoreductase [Pelagibaculum spongiae]|uniref:NADH:ubiquinone reductase (non-electrogenic) n=1 Tax=Pelagibaculum spongiae TaxID=2080658 RepID=A0A2V1H0A0_9GAMM|nr:FAD-dependent oxidoreductase [Pelagibaculum spongiae]PVZ71893.1 nucleotide-disulfide oxidoreductase [Pelagibaculum spongiae]
MARQKILVLGGGFGGVFCAKHLQKLLGKDHDIELVCENNYFVFQPLLPEVAAGTINAEDAVSPLRALLPGVKFRMADIRRIDHANQRVYVMQGRKRVMVPLSYDQLVIASGQQVDLSRFPGLQEHALRMKNLADAHRLRNHIINCLEHADVTHDPQLKRRLLTFIVAGGGFSGVETTGEMEEMLTRSLKFYPNITRAEIRIMLIEYLPRILPELPEKLADYTALQLKKRGIEMLLGVGIKSATGTMVETMDGQRLETATIVATIGNGPSQLLKALPVELERGKLATDSFFQVKGMERVWALGDAALIPLPEDKDGKPRFAPPTAQFASREALCLARNMQCLLTEKPLKPFDYKPLGSLASIGAYKAVGEMFGIKLSGTFAWILWRTFYLGMLPGGMTKLRVGINWFLDYCFPRTTVKFKQWSEPSARYLRFAQGDIVFYPGQIPEGFYTIVKGTLGVTMKGPDGQQFIKTMGKGEHLGERELLGQIPGQPSATTGAVTALEETTVLVMDRKDFRRFTKVFPALEQYFEEYIESHYPEYLKPVPIEDPQQKIAN